MRNFYRGIKLVLPTVLLLIVGLVGIEASNTKYLSTCFAEPIAGDDVFSTEMGISISGDLLTNDSDPDGGSLSVVPVPFPAPSNGSIFITNSGTFSYTPNPGFTGVDQFGYRVCNSANECVIATVTIYVWPAGCTPAEEIYAASSCDACTSVCIDFPLVDLENNYAVTQNGGTYNGGMTGCNFNDVHAYSYSDLLGQGSNGPYELLSWNVDGTVHSGAFNNPQELVNLMNTRNPVGRWFLNSSQLLILGGSSNSTYSNMTVENSAAPNSTSTLTFNMQTTPLGTTVCLPAGTHELAFNPLDGSCPNETATITIDCITNPPVIVDDNYTTIEGTDISENVLDNDSDPLGVGLMVSLPLINEPTNGTVNQNADGTFTYTPNADFVGTDSYTYEACNADDCGEATVTITVQSSSNPPIAVDDTYTVDEGTAYMNNVFINDTEPDGDPITITIVTFPNNGALQMNTTGGFTYVPGGGFTGSDSFVYELCDTDGLCDQATVTLNVMEVNNPPLAVDDTYNILVGETLDDNLLDNDSDPEGGILTLTTTTIAGPQMGIVTLNANGTFNYMSPPNFVGTDQFTYEVCDDAGNCSQAIVTINITIANDPPFAVDDNYSISAGSPLLENVTANDTDEDMSSITVTLQSQPANGAISMNSDGSFTYMPLAGYTGEDQFTYEICDDAGLCDQATVFITVGTTCNNDVEDFSSEICDDCVYLCLDIPADDIDNYEITIDGLTYTGDMLACDLDTFIAYTYFTLLGGGDQGPYELLSWIIDEVPYTGLFDNPTELVNLMNIINPTGNWQLDAQTSIIYGGDPSSTYSVMEVQNLAVPFSFSEIGFNEGTMANGTAICVEQGLHVVEATLNGEDCPSIEINANIDCQGNLPPIAEDDSYSTNMDINISDNVTLNDSDPNGDIITVNTILVSDASNGVVMMGSTGIFNYIPDAGFTGIDMFTYEICDGSGLCDEAVVTIIVLGSSTNNPPLAEDDNYTTNMDVILSGNVMDNDVDSEGDIITANTTLVDLPSNGTATLSPDGTFEYTPNAGYTGTDMFTYEICDEEGLCDEAVVTITIIDPSTNNPPIAEDDSYTTNADIIVSENVMDNDADPDGDIITVSNLINQPSNGTVILNEDGTFEYTPNAGYTGTDMFTYEICDEEGLCDEAIVTITILPQGCIIPEIDNVAKINASCGGTDGSIQITLTGNVSDYTFDWATGVGTASADGSQLSDLPQGVYSVTITHTSGTACSIVEEDILISEGGIEVTDTTLEPATCDAADGKAAFLPNTYIYTWEDGTISNERDDLAAGTYTVTITDVSLPGCASTVSIDILTNNPLIADANIIAQPYCGYPTGEVSITANGSDNYSYVWSDGNTDMTRNDLVTGVYGITVTDTDTGCEAMTSVSLDGGNCMDTISIQIPQAAPFDTCLTALYDLPGTLTTADVCLDNPNTVVVTVNSNDACITLDPTDTFEGTDTLCVYHCNELGYCDTTTIIVSIIPNCVDDFLGTDDNILIEADSCGGVAQFCLPIPFGEFQNYLVTDNGTTIPMAVAGCDIEETIFYTYISLIGDGELGPYNLDSWTVGENTFSGEFQNISDLVDSMNIWDPTGEWTLDASAELISGVGDGSLYSNMEVTHIQTSGPYTIGFNNGEYANSSYVELNIGMHELIVTETATGCIDTIQVEVYCLTNDTLYHSILVNSNDTTCFSIPTTLPGNIDLASISNTCLDNSGTEVMFNPATEDGTEICVSYTGLAVGVDSACITICDDLGICETTTLIIEVTTDELLDVVDTLYVGDMEVICPEDFGYSSAFDTLTNICPELGGESVAFDLDQATGCIMYTALGMGTDTACIMYCDVLAGICDTAYIYVHVLDTTTNVAPIAINDTETVSAGTAEFIDVLANDTLNGELQTITTISDPNHGFADVQGDSIILYTPDEGFCGQDSFSYIICNETACDTAIVTIEVNCMAVDDIDSTLQGIPVLIDVVANDSLGGTLQSLVITEDPFNGTVIVLGDTIVLYTPIEGFCGQDSFVYTICNETVCDMATVVVDVECSDFEVYTAMSPNGDGVNDFFIINGIAQFETVSLTIFNRWGNRVFEMNNERYSNIAGEGGKGPWDGTWNGKQLPDGTYFYYLELPDGSGLKSGYIQLRR